MATNRTHEQGRLMREALAAGRIAAHYAWERASDESKRVYWDERGCTSGLPQVPSDQESAWREVGSPRIKLAHEVGAFRVGFQLGFAAKIEAYRPVKP